MKKQLLKVVCLLLSVSLLCSCGAPEDESTLSSVLETAGQTESSVDEATSSQGASIAETEVVPEVTKKPETEENSVAETTTEKTETTITTTKPTATESTPKPETTIPTTTTKKPETSATPKPETTTATTTKKPETTATPKPETTTSTTTTKASETTTIATEKPDVAPTGHCEGFDKLWGMNLSELKQYQSENNSLWLAENCSNWGEKSGINWRFYKDTNLFGLKIPYGSYCYTSDYSITLLCETHSSDELQNIVYGFQLCGGGWSTYCPLHEENETEVECLDYNTIFIKLKELYGEPNKSRSEGELKVNLWSNTLDGDIILSNDMNINGRICYRTVVLNIYDSNHKFTKEDIDYHFSFKV